MIAFASFFFVITERHGVSTVYPGVLSLSFVGLLLYTICTVVHELEISIFIPTVLTVCLDRIRRLLCLSPWNI